MFTNLVLWFLVVLTPVQGLGGIITPEQVDTLKRSASIRSGDEPATRHSPREANPPRRSLGKPLSPADRATSLEIEALSSAERAVPTEALDRAASFREANQDSWNTVGWLVAIVLVVGLAAVAKANRGKS